MSDQPQGVEDLAQLLDNEDLPEQETEEAQADEEEGEGEQPDEEEGGEQEAEAEPESEASEKYRIKVKNDRGEDEEKELTLEELAEGYMLSSDYTRKRQQEAEQIRQTEHKYVEAIRQDRQQSAEVIDQLKAFVVQTISPELSNLTPQLAADDPAEFVRLQAKHQQISQILGQLEQTKQQNLMQSQQAEQYHRELFLKQCQEYVNDKIPEFKNPEYKSQLMTFAEKTYNITQQDLAYLAAAPMFKDGHMLDSGVVLKVLNDAMKWNGLQAQKPMAQKKVAVAPRIIKPLAPKPKSQTMEAKKRLAKSGRIDDLAALLS